MSRTRGRVILIKIIIWFIVLFSLGCNDNKDILDKIELIRDECLSNPTRFRVLDLKSNLNQYFSYNYGWLFTLRMRFYSNEKKTLLFVA